jgi:hypothetical protein
MRLIVMMVTLPAHSKVINQPVSTICASFLLRDLRVCVSVCVCLCVCVYLTLTYHSQIVYTARGVSSTLSKRN